MLKPIQTSIILTLGLLATAGCSSWQSMCPDFVPLGPANSLDYRKCPPPPPPPPSLEDQLAAAQKQNVALSRRVSDLERQLADRDREIASLRSGAGDSAKLASQLVLCTGEPQPVTTTRAHCRDTHSVAGIGRRPPGQGRRQR